MDRVFHWENIYSTKNATDVSWYRSHLETSLQLISQSEISKTGQIIDVGGGASTLVDDLIAREFENVTVLDISSVAISSARARLGDRAERVTWLSADITEAVLSEHFYDLWHDRAVFHFLTGAEERRNYVSRVKNALKPNGHLIIATFSSDGPTKCSGLDVNRYSPETLHDEVGKDFDLISSLAEDHLTPFNSVQRFVYCHFRLNSDRRFEARL